MHRNRVELFQQGIVADESVLGLRDLMELAVEVLDGVGHINDPADRFRVLEHGGEFVPVLAPGLDRRRVLGSPGGFQLIQRNERRFLRRRFIDGFHRSREYLDVLIRYIPRRAADP